MGNRAANHLFNVAASTIRVAHFSLRMACRVHRRRERERLFLPALFPAMAACSLHHGGCGRADHLPKPLLDRKAPSSEEHHNFGTPLRTSNLVLRSILADVTRSDI